MNRKPAVDAMAAAMKAAEMISEAAEAAQAAKSAGCNASAAPAILDHVDRLERCIHKLHGASIVLENVFALIDPPEDSEDWDDFTALHLVHNLVIGDTALDIQRAALALRSIFEQHLENEPAIMTTS